MKTFKILFLAFILLSNVSFADDLTMIGLDGKPMNNKDSIESKSAPKAKSTAQNKTKNTTKNQKTQAQKSKTAQKHTNIKLAPKSTKPILNPLNSQNHEVSLDFLHQSPRGISRDFYIWLFFNQKSTSKEQAKAAKKLVSRDSARLSGAYYSKIGYGGGYSKKDECEKLSPNELIKRDAKCIEYGMRLKKAQKYDKAIIAEAAQKINAAKNGDKALAGMLFAISSKDPLGDLLRRNSAAALANYYFAATEARAPLNKPILPKTLAHLINQKNKKFLQMCRHAIINNMSYFNKSLSEIPPSQILPTLDYEVAFYFGLNSARFGKNADALEYFEYSKDKSKYKFWQNRADFWSYLVSDNSNYLNEVAASTNLDIYSLAAVELTNAAPQWEIAYSAPSDLKPTKAGWNVNDPFEWERLKERYKLAKKQNNKNQQEHILDLVRHKDTEAHYLRLLGYDGREFFITPYKEAFGKYDDERKSLLYALCRQESLFVPTAISTSYALGLMQLMPFNVIKIAKDFGEWGKVGYLSMFEPEINVKYAEYFVRPLVKEFKHPIFISYAYNGGPGFTRRMLDKKELFWGKSELDPWLSIELVPIEESRTYGKKVLANYVVYSNYFGNSVKLLELLNQLDLSKRN